MILETPILLQKSFVLSEEGKLLSLDLSKVYDTLTPERDEERLYAATSRTRGWVSRIDPQGLCSMVIMNPVRALVRTRELTMIGGRHVWTPEFEIVSLAVDFKDDRELLAAPFSAVRIDRVSDLERGAIRHSALRKLTKGFR